MELARRAVIEGADMWGELALAAHRAGRLGAIEVVAATIPAIAAPFLVQQEMRHATH